MVAINCICITNISELIINGMLESFVCQFIKVNPLIGLTQLIIIVKQPNILSI